jgi:DNA-binding YbaB/EbfC family protein
MFGDLMGMMGKLQETQRKVAETKKRLDTVLIDEQSSDGLLKVTVTANRQVKSITIDDSLLEDKEQLEDYLLLVMNKAIQRATQINEAEPLQLQKTAFQTFPECAPVFKIEQRPFHSKKEKDRFAAIFLRIVLQRSGLSTQWSFVFFLLHGLPSKSPSN